MARTAPMPALAPVTRTVLPGLCSANASELMEYELTYPKGAMR